MDVLAAPEVRGKPAARQALAEQDLRRAIARAAVLGTGKVVVFSGGLAWPYFYPYPPRPAGLIERASVKLETQSATSAPSTGLPDASKR
ncbi:hypothetical protein IVB41_08115 [Bradyrhizobium sp. 44]|uniref:hypothetical protein n=1 Tax=Bradyrhizobium sp. 44 TaxID=2782675 RepID=UPI001FF97126|nr:hypothetical protein [Bradyrhizobium sp. 44]MCK1283902.1 hypothetical protein [Bradyrhizobium sp. 44]